VLRTGSLLLISGLLFRQRDIFVMLVVNICNILGLNTTAAIILLLKENCVSRSQWPRGLRHGSAAARLLGLWVRIPPGGMDVCCCECYVLSGRGLCDGLITLPEESYRVYVTECHKGQQ
jgi:hypothetical protein